MLPALSAFSHEPGITDTSIKMGHATVKLVYTLPNSEHKNNASNDYYNQNNQIKSAYTIKNNESTCRLISFQSLALDNINSSQYSYLYDCKAALDNVSIHYNFLSTKNNHKNIIRLSIAGRHQSFSFTSSYRSHTVPVSILLKKWNRILQDGQVSSINKSQFTSDLWQSNDYFNIGFFHILEGYDHILFLLGLLLLPISIKNLFLVTSTFTIAHSITLAISIIKDINVPPYIIESAIAFSIIYIGLENLWHLRNKHSKESLSSKHKTNLKRLMIVFIFGLIHGFGFSYRLKEIGFEDQLTGALLFFNIGVEAGQLLIIAITFPILAALYKFNQNYHISKMGSIFITTLGSLWLIERLS
jgi:hydrogenase/urease accessory protein HupE